jgi:clan AA aspartic protease (TIGR02281 family)
MGRLLISFFSIFLLAVFSSPNSFATTYKWIDSGGTMHFSDNFDDIPPEYRNNLKTITEPHEIGQGAVIPFEKTATGLILVDAVLNDQVRARMVFDTGANLVVITEELSKKLNQDLSSRDEVMKLHTNCGEIEGRSLVIDKVELGEARKENVRSVITPNNYAISGFDGLLGLSFLGDFKVTVDYQNSRMILSK